jgi:hypothetical protein
MWVSRLVFTGHTTFFALLETVLARIAPLQIVLPRKEGS